MCYGCVYVEYNSCTGTPYCSKTGKPVVTGEAIKDGNRKVYPWEPIDKVCPGKGCGWDKEHKN